MTKISRNHSIILIIFNLAIFFPWLLCWRIHSCDKSMVWKQNLAIFLSLARHFNAILYIFGNKVNSFRFPSFSQPLSPTICDRPDSVYALDDDFSSISHYICSVWIKIERRDNKKCAFDHFEESITCDKESLIKCVESTFSTERSYVMIVVIELTVAWSTFLCVLLSILPFANEN